MRTVFAALAAAAAMLLPVGAALACSCSPATSAAEQLAGTDLAFTGRVLGTRVDRQRYAVTRFRIVEVIKGRASRTVAVTHHTDDATCGLTYKKGARAMVLADRDEGSWRTSLCSAPRFEASEFRRAARAPAPAPAPLR